MSTRVPVNILKSFRHIYGNKDLNLRAGGIYYLDMDIPEDRDELLYIMSGSFPYTHYKSVEMTPALMQVLALSKFDVKEKPPASPSLAQVYYNSLTGKAYIWDGSAWRDMTCCNDSGTGGTGTSTVPALFGDVTSDGFSNEVQISPNVIVDGDISPSAGIKLSKLERNPLDRTNHTGTQAASTIHDFLPTVSTVPLNQMAPPNGNVSMSNYRITNLQSPIAGTDAANKDYVDQAITALGFTSPLPLSKGGTGVAATSPVMALNALEGIANGRNLPVSGTPPSDSGRIFFGKSTGTGTTPSYLDFRRIAVTSPLTITENADHLLIGFTNTGGAGLDINTALVGYPLAVNKGGTGATTPTNARINLGAVGKGENSLGDSTTTGNVYRDVINSNGDINMRFRSLVETPMGAIDINQVGNDIYFAVKQGELSLANIGGSINLATNQATGVLPISKGGTNATTIAGARDNLDIIYDARLVTGATGQSPLASPAVLQTAGDGGVIQVKGIKAGNNITIVSTGSDIEISASTGLTSSGMNIGTGLGMIYANNNGSILNFKTLLAGPGVNIVNGTSEVTISARAENLPGAGAMVLNTPLPTTPGSPIQFRTITGGMGVTVVQNTNDITISSLSPTAVANVGTKPGQVFKDITSGTINLRTIGGTTGSLSTDGIQVLTSGDQIHLSTLITNASNIGTAQPVLATPTPISTAGTVLQFKGIKAGRGTSVASSTTTDVVIDTLLVGVGTGQPILVSETPAQGSPYELKDILAGPGVSITTVANDIVISATGSSMSPGYGINILNSIVSTNATNLGGQQVLLTNAGSTIVEPMKFKGITAGTNVSLANSSATEVIIDVTGVVTGATNVTAPPSLSGTYSTGTFFRDYLNPTLNFKTLHIGSTLSGYPGATVTNNTSDVVVDLHIVNAQSLATQQHIYTTGAVTSPGTTLQFKGIKAGNGISLTNSTTTDVVIDSVFNATNIGTGSQSLVTPIPTTGPIQFRTILGTNGITVTQLANEIQIAGPTLNTPISIGTGTPVYKGLNETNQEYRSILGGYGVIAELSTSTNEVLVRAHAENLPGIGQLILSTASQLEADPLRFKTISPAATNPGITVTSDLNNIYLQANLAGVTQVGTGVAITSSTLPLAPGSTLNLKSILGGHGITAENSTSGNEVNVKAHVANIGTGVPVLANPTGTDTDPLNFRAIKGKTGSGIEVTLVGSDVEINYVPIAGAGFSTTGPISPVSSAGVHTWTVTHNLGLPAPFTQFTYLAYDSGTGDTVLMGNITPVDGNTVQFKVATGGAAPSTSTHFRFVKAL